jgi:hypothetical protein
MRLYLADSIPKKKPINLFLVGDRLIGGLYNKNVIA